MQLPFAFRKSDPMASRKPPPGKLRDPLSDLPSFNITRIPAITRDQSAREDVSYAVNSLDDIVREARRRFGQDLGQKKMLVGFLNSASPDTYRFGADSFREGVAQAGLAEGWNIRIEERWANGDHQVLPALAAELVTQGVAAIAATGDVASVRAAQGASRNTPIVFSIDADPVRLKLVASLSRPGGHVTGISSPVLGAKRIELLCELAPSISRIALLMNPDVANTAAEQEDAENGAKILRRKMVVIKVRNPDEVDAALQELLRAKADAFMTATDPILFDRLEPIVAFAAHHALPAVYFVRQFAVAGGLLSYGPSVSWMYRQAGAYVGQILKGASPAELPVMQTTQFELVINRRTAKTIGIEIPQSLLARADEVIE
jgi:putative tryptophan/tyrosine transport system substrate-binding protein